MVDDCTASVFSPDRVRFCGANDRDAEMFAARAARTSVSVRAFTDEMPHSAPAGPGRAVRCLQPLANQDLSNESFPYYTFRDDVEIAGIPIFMTRLGYTAELGYELWVDLDRALDLWDASRRRLHAEGHGDHRHRHALRPLPDRRRVHHRRHQVRPHRLAVRVRPRLGGRLGQGRLSRARTALVQV